MIPPPSNLLARRYRFKGELKRIVTMTPDEVRTIIEAAPGQLKLHLLFMLNFRFLQQDVSDLAWAEVDWENGRITRKRSNTDDKAGVPTLSYRLWPQTLELLRRFRSNHPTLALTTQSGRSWVRDFIDEKGIRRRVDAVKSDYAHLCKRLGLKKPMSTLRKTGPSLLEEHGEFGHHSQHFLGQAPTSIAAKLYVSPSREQFDRAVTWLGEQIEY